MSQSSIEQSSRPSASSSFHNFTSISYYIPDSKKAAPRIAAAFVASGDVVDEMDGLDPAKAPDVLSAWGADHPLIKHKFPNLIITPHIAWAAKEARQRALDRIAENIAAFLNNKPINVVNE